jgi:hypothetical protein
VATSVLRLGSAHFGSTRHGMEKHRWRGGVYRVLRRHVTLLCLVKGVQPRGDTIAYIYIGKRNVDGFLKRRTVTIHMSLNITKMSQ